MRCSLSLTFALALAACQGDISHAPEGDQQQDPSTQGDAAPAAGEDAATPPSPVDAGRTDGGSPPPPPVDAGSGEADAAVPPPPRVDGPNETRALFQGAHVYFGAENRRELNQAADLPEDAYQYQNITLTLALRCPEGGCDAWDRHGHLSIVQNPDTPEAREVEILRFVTPYRKEMTTTLDVTDLRPLLTGHVMARVFIDTWVGPGNSAGAGWLVDATLAFTGGTPPHDVLDVVPLWSPRGVVVGDPSRGPTQSAAVEVPAGARGAQLWTLITGHGQGNAGNCAEFCSAEHTLDVAGQPFRRVIWRDDCATTAVPDQAGTWMYARAGWCPGAAVRPWIEDVSSAIAGGSSLDLAWSPADYVNSCRQGVPDNQCSGCVFGTGCAYDGGAHTEPFYQLSALLVITR